MKKLNDRQRQVFERTREFAEEDRSRSIQSVVLAHTLFFVCSVCAAVSSILVLKGLFSVLAGLLLMRCFVLYHDFLHGSILKNSRAADVFFTCFSVILLTPKAAWRETHNYHHAHNSKLPSTHIGSYKQVSIETWHSMNTSEKLMYRWIRHPLNMLFGAVTVFLIGMVFTPLLRNFKKNRDAFLVLISYIFLSVSLIVLLGFANYVFCLLIPQAIASVIGSYLFYVQHNFPTVKISPLKDWSYYDAAVEASSFMHMHPIMHWFTANIGYHHVHHLNPKIPFYRLPEAMKAIPELAPKHVISFSLRDIKACLSLKVWDATKGKMVGYP